MAGKVQQKRDVLRAKLIELARDRIAEGGPHGIKARDLATAAGCSVGAIYTLFDDLNDLVMVVNLQTFQDMGAFVTQALDDDVQSDNVERLVVMGRAYLDFASENHGIWRTLFDLEVSEARPVPDWYWGEMVKVFDLIETPLAQALPDKSLAEIKQMSRILFSSVHGLVSLGLEQSIFGMPKADLENMIEVMIRRII